VCIVLDVHDCIKLFVEICVCLFKNIPDISLAEPPDLGSPR
jgi:hypothetical protein